MQTINLGLFLVDACLYFTFMAALLHFRYRLGLGVFLTALGVMHFMETYLAAVFYVQLPFGIVSPGSSILFAGKLMMILLLYMKEDAATVRQPIYGLFLGNLLTVAIALVLQFHGAVELSAGKAADLSFLRDMGGLMIWGTTLLYLDSIGIILLYERLGRWLPRRTVLRYLISGMVILTFDQVGFFAVLHYFFDAPMAVFWGGWQAKMLSVLVFSALFALYQRFAQSRRMGRTTRPIADVFNDLTFRERYEDLLARAGRDTLTGAFDRNRMEIEGPKLVEDGTKHRVPVSVLIADTDHFKQVNDQFGHMQGDVVLKLIAAQLQASLRPEDLLFRFGGEEFVVLAPKTGHDDALALADLLRQRIERAVLTPENRSVTLSFGVATMAQDGSDFQVLLAAADERLYRAKNDGRNCVFGRDGRITARVD